MGQYFRMVCHHCKRRLPDTLGKLAELEAHAEGLLKVANFVTRHAGHHVELRGDEWTYDGSIDQRDVEDYANE